MIAIGIVTYNEVIDKTKNAVDIYEFVLHLINTIHTFTTDEYVLIIVDNGSLDYRFQYLNKVLKIQFKDINSIFIRNNQNDLTSAWNIIVDTALNTLDCSGVILLNQDILLTKYWMPFVKAVQYQAQDVIAPMATGACYQPLQEVSENSYIVENKILVTKVVQGFCFGASKECFKNNMYNKTNYFNPGFSWDFNETEFQQRNNKIGGKSLILKNAYVIHLDQCSWLHAGLRSQQKLEDYTGEERLLVLDKFAYSAYYNCK